MNNKEQNKIEGHQPGASLKARIAYTADAGFIPYDTDLSYYLREGYALEAYIGKEELLTQDVVKQFFLEGEPEGTEFYFAFWDLD